MSDEGLKVLEEGNLEGKERSGGLSEKQWAVVRYTDAMTRDVSVKEEVFEELKRHFDEKEVVEITATVSHCLVSYYFRNGLLNIDLGLC